MIPDYHMHTHFSDGEDVHEEYIHQAAKAGISEIGFTDHFSILPSDWNTPSGQVQAMKNKILNLKNTKPLPVEVKFGAEIDYIPGKENEIKSMIQQLPLDYVIGSVHFIDSWNFDTAPEEYDGRDIDDLYKRYYSLLEESVQTGFYDIIGHFDLIKKFGYYPETQPVKQIEKVIQTMRSHDLTAELNTNGINKPCGEMYPSREILELLFRHNVPVTLSSDAHKPGQVGQYFPEAIELLKSVGYRKIAAFSGRKRTLVDLT